MEQFREPQYKEEIFEHAYQDEVYAKASLAPAAPSSKKRLVFKRSDEVDNDVRLEFSRLARRWKADIAFSSSTHEHYFHPSYQRIIGLGKEVLPLIISDLRDGEADWFWALQCITGKDPVRKSMWGDFAKARAAWLNWAEKNI